MQKMSPARARAVVSTTVVFEAGCKLIKAK